MDEGIATIIAAVIGGAFTLGAALAAVRLNRAGGQLAESERSLRAGTGDDSPGGAAAGGSSVTIADLQKTEDETQAIWRRNVAWQARLGLAPAIVGLIGGAGLATNGDAVAAFFAFLGGTSASCGLLFMLFRDGAVLMKELSDETVRAIVRRKMADLNALPPTASDKRLNSPASPPDQATPD